jgi:hypothetical protein
MRDAALRLSVLYVGDTEEVSVGQSTYRWFMGRLDLCPFSMGDDSGRVCPCAAVEAGAVRSDGSYTPRDAAPETVPANWLPWFAGLALLRLDLRTLGPAWLEADAGVAFPFTRYGYGFDDLSGQRTTVRVIPKAGVLGGIGVRLELL